MVEFRTIHTQYGLEALARAEASGTAINLTHMAVGDGNGSPVAPSYEQENLVRELYRSTVNRVFQSSDDPNRFTAELVIPVSASGFVLREVGIFDETGSLFAVGNLPETYKPTAEEGAFADTVVRMDFMVSNAGIVTLQIDPNVAVATQTWISNNITAATLIPGGTTYQVLRKKSNSDGHFEWHDPEVANVVVDVIEERQALVAGQTNVILNIVTTRGLAVYVNGQRLPNSPGAGGWQASSADPDTTVVLGQAYAAGSTIILAQNEPTGSVPYPLVRDLNLSDVPDKALGRTNLGVHSKDESDAAGQPGDIKYTARNSAPTGWLKANGAAISRTAYAGLFSAIGTTFGAGDGFNTFNIPDLRGVVIRGLDDGRGLDPDRAFGSYQSDSTAAHSHSASSSTAGAHTHGGSIGSGGNHSHGISDPGHAHQQRTEGENSGVRDTDHSGADTWQGHDFRGYWTGGAVTGISISAAGEHNHALSINQADGHSHALTIGQTGGAETRMKNTALLPCIKY